MDFGRCLARRAGLNVDLTPLEFKVLESLLRARGRMMTRDQLIDQVWGNGVSITDRVVDNHIMNLRTETRRNPHRTPLPAERARPGIPVRKP